MKEKILKLRFEGKSYREIMKELNCSSSTISYYCSEGQKEKSLNRTKNRQLKNSLIKRTENFKQRKLRNGVRDFQRRNKYGLETSVICNFNHNNILDKFGINTQCYLSGEKINLIKDSHYHLDHIKPISKGGENNIDNLGITHKIVNKIKGDLEVDELLYWCKKILEFNNYKVERKVD